MQNPIEDQYLERMNSRRGEDYIYDFRDAAKWLADIFVEYDLVESIKQSMGEERPALADALIAETCVRSIRQQLERERKKNDLLYEYFMKTLPFAGELDYYRQKQEEDGNDDLTYENFCVLYLDQDAAFNSLLALVAVHEEHGGLE